MIKYLYRLLASKLILFLSRHPYVALLGGILYVLMPFDFLPEALTGLVGFVDDFVALTMSIFLMQKLKKWKSRETSEARDPYAILGISPRATQEQLKQAYRAKMAEYHPDKVAHLGKDLQKVALLKAQEIQSAYESLKKKD